MLGGDIHETTLYPCRPCHAWRRRILVRNGVSYARHESPPRRADRACSTGQLRLQRLGSLLAAAVLRLLPSALLWRLGLASLVAPLAPLELLVRHQRKGPLAPFFFCRLFRRALPDRRDSFLHRRH